LQALLLRSTGALAAGARQMPALALLCHFIEVGATEG